MGKKKLSASMEAAKTQLKAKSAKASVWDKVSAVKPEKSRRGRDIVNRQQVDRGEMEPVIGPKANIIITIVIFFVSFAILWSAIAACFGGVQYQFKHARVTPTGVYYIQGTWDDPHLNPQQRDALRQTMDKKIDKINALRDAKRQQLIEQGKLAPDSPPAPHLTLPESPEYVSTPRSEEKMGDVVLYYMLSFTWGRFFGTLLGSLAIAAIAGIILENQRRTMNVSRDMRDVNTHENDSRLALPEEIIDMYTLVPDVGAHFAAEANTLISHIGLTNKGLKKVDFTVFAEEDLYDDEGNLLYYKGEAMYDDDDNLLTKKVPFIDEKFTQKLWDSALVLEDPRIRYAYDPSKIKHNPGGANRDKSGKQDTVADLINETWEYPWYEPQRAGGAYIVSESPVNTIVIAITRGGKGQTYIEPIIDVWSREKRKRNMVVNDPKGELVTKNFVRLTVRGYQVIQFNLIDSTKTDIYNPLSLAAQSAREGDMVKTAAYVDAIADVFFPTDVDGSDPMWNNAASNAFRRAVYGMIDFYYEEERELRNFAVKTGMHPKVLDQKLDEMWGRVTLYNVYQEFVQLSAKTVKNPVVRVQADIKAGKYGDDPGKNRTAVRFVRDAKEQEPFWEGKPEVDMLSLFFNATKALPLNAIRREVSNADNSLRAMGDSDKMLASVYGIAITQMSFFTNPTISRMTSGRPSQNVDLGGMSFPRCLSVRFDSIYIRKNGIANKQVVYRAYKDSTFTEPMDAKKFGHQDTLTPEGWAHFFFDGILKGESMYLKLEIRNIEKNTLIKSFYFRFTKGYETNLVGDAFTVNPITREKIVKNGILEELRPVTDEDGNTVYKPGMTTYKSRQVVVNSDDINASELNDVESVAIVSTRVRYTEKPRAIFLITPPHLTSYVKLTLIFVKQLVDMNFDQSYMTRANQKPDYGTAFLLDEAGNLQSDGQGLANFQTHLSIGLGQSQQFTVILQTLQQLKDVYGDSVDKIIQGNAAHLVFLKSNDDDMLETLSKLSGTRHVTRSDSKTVTKSVKSPSIASNDDKVSVTYATVEEPVLRVTDMLQLPPRNSLVFIASEFPIWNRNNLSMPMSFALFSNTIIDPGKDYSFKTLPTTSTAAEFDVRTNQPDFFEMVDKRLSQAQYAVRAKKLYQEKHGFDDYEMGRQDPEVASNHIMNIVDAMRYIEKNISEAVSGENGAPTDTGVTRKAGNSALGDSSEWGESDDVKQAVRKAKKLDAYYTAKIYANKTMSRDMLVYPAHTSNDVKPSHTQLMDEMIVESYLAVKPAMIQDQRFKEAPDGGLMSSDGATSYIVLASTAADANRVKKHAINDDGKDVGDRDMNHGSRFKVTDAFITLLVKLDSWDDIADGAFSQAMAERMANVDM